jgi:uncharacterized coiled-coil protein SlyX
MSSPRRPLFRSGNDGGGSGQPAPLGQKPSTAGPNPLADRLIQLTRKLEGEAQRAVEQAATRAAEAVAKTAESERLTLTTLAKGASGRVAELIDETRRLTQKVAQLERTVAEQSTAQAALSDTLAEQADLLRRQTSRLDMQDELLAGTGQTLTHYIETVDALRARLVMENRSLTDADSLVHYQLGERLMRLFTQRLPELTNVRATAGQARTDGTDALRHEAQQVRQMCLALFDAEEQDLGRLAAIVTDSGRITLSEQQARLLERVQQEAASLRKAIEDTGHPYVFIFDLPPGTDADRGQHELWTSAAEGEPVAFVVTPGYVVSGRRILPPAVITVRN